MLSLQIKRLMGKIALWTRIVNNLKRFNINATPGTIESSKITRALKDSRERLHKLTAELDYTRGQQRAFEEGEPKCRVVR